MRRSVGLILACAGLIAFDAKADEAPLRARLRFSSPAGCGNAADFGERVQRRAPRVRFGTRGPDSVSVHIARGANGLDARVSLATGGRRLGERRIEAETCEDALDALALVVAVTLEGHERTRRERVRRSRAPGASPTLEGPPPEPRPSESPPAEAVAAEPAASPETPPPAEGAPEPPAEPAPPPEPSPPAPVPPVVDAPPQSSGARSSWRAGIGAGPAFNVGAAPSLMPGWLVYGRFGWELAPPWSPELIVSFTSLARDGFDQTAGSADFRLQTLSAELCPLRWILGSVSGMSCAQVAYGRLKVRGYDTIAASEYDRPWTTLGASAQLSAHFSFIELRAQLGAGFPLARDRFRFEPEPTVHHVPSVTFGGSIAVGLGFP